MTFLAAVALDSLAVFLAHKKAKTADQRGFGGALGVWTSNRHAADGS